MRRTRTAALVAAAVALVVAACGGETGGDGTTAGGGAATSPPDTVAATTAKGWSETETAPKGGTLRIAVVSDYDYWDGTSYYGDMWAVAGATCNGLMAYPEVLGEGSGDLVPAIAAAPPEVSADGLTYTFTIRQGIRYADGTPLVPADVKDTYERNLDPASGFTDGALGSGYYNVIAGFDEFTKTDADGNPAPDRATEISGILVDGDTVAFTLTQPTPTFPYATALGFMCIVPTGTKRGHTTLPPPATGPYMLAEYTPGRSARMVRNPVWPGNAKAMDQARYTNIDNVDEFVFEIGPSPDQQFLRIKNDELDISQNDDAPSGSQVNEVANDPLYAERFSATDDSAVSYVFLNTSIAPFDNVKLRQAANYAVDREALLKVVGGKYNGLPWSAILPRPLMDGLAGDDIYPNRADPERSRALIAESGVPDPSFELAYITAAGANDQVAAALKQQLEQGGFSVSLKPVSSSVYYQLIQDPANEIQAGMAGWGQDFPDGVTFFRPLLHSDAAGGNGPNYSQLASPELDAEIERVDALPLGPERTRGFAELARSVSADYAPWIAFRSRLKPHFWSSRVGNHAYGPNRQLYYRLLHVNQ